MFHSYCNETGVISSMTLITDAYRQALIIVLLFHYNHTKTSGQKECEGYSNFFNMWISVPKNNFVFKENYFYFIYRKHHQCCDGYIFNETAGHCTGM